MANSILLFPWVFYFIFSSYFYHSPPWFPLCLPLQLLLLCLITIYSPLSPFLTQDDCNLTRFVYDEISLHPSFTSSCQFLLILIGLFLDWKFGVVQRKPGFCFMTTGEIKKRLFIGIANLFFDWISGPLCRRKFIPGIANVIKTYS